MLLVASSLSAGLHSSTLRSVTLSAGPANDSLTLNRYANIFFALALLSSLCKTLHSSISGCIVFLLKLPKVFFISTIIFIFNCVFLFSKLMIFHTKLCHLYVLLQVSRCLSSTSPKNVLSYPALSCSVKVFQTI